MTHHRNATNEEVIKNVRVGRKMSYRHFLMELPRINAKNGVMHRQRSSNAIFMTDGVGGSRVPAVRHHGKVEQLTGSICTLDSGQEIFYDLRIKSEYLK